MAAGSFPRDLSRLDSCWLWACDQGLYDARPLNDILSVQAAGYGGGSLLYANVAVRPPPEVFAAGWPAPYGREMLEPYFDLAAHMLEVQPVGAAPATGRLRPKADFMAEAARRMGHAGGFFHPNLAVTFDDRGPEQVNRFGVPQRGCVFVGECDIGCNVGARTAWTTTPSRWPSGTARPSGTRTEAVHIGQSADGSTVRLREHGHPGAGKDGVRRDVRARRVFVCAGALGTTELLLRSRDRYGTLPDLPAGLGMGYSGNGDFLSFGRLDPTRDQRFMPGRGRPSRQLPSCTPTGRGSNTGSCWRTAATRSTSPGRWAISTSGGCPPTWHVRSAPARSGHSSRCAASEPTSPAAVVWPTRRCCSRWDATAPTAGSAYGAVPDG